jgi:hypothetical protein
MKIQRDARPPWKDPGFKGRIIRRRVRPTLFSILDEFLVIWVQPNGIPFNALGFRCEIIRPNRTRADVAQFDSFGVARSDLRAPLTSPRGTWTIRISNRNTGLVFRVRRFVMPARGISVFVVIG